MCGIFGYSGKTKSSIDKIKILGLYNIERGEDSTGFLWVNEEISKVNSEIKKSFGSDKKLVNIKRYIEFYNNDVKNLEQKLLIGHVRKKTVGHNTMTNAHPFVYENLSGVHNGTLTHYYFLLQHYKDLFKKENNLEKLKVLESVDVKNASDSRILYALMNVVDELEILKSFAGAAAFVYTDKNQYLRMYRNADRPLFYGKTEDGMYFSSIKDSLNGIDILSKDIESLDVDVLYTIYEGEIVSTEKVERVPLVPVIEEKREDQNVIRNVLKGTGVNPFSDVSSFQCSVKVIGAKDIIKGKNNIRISIDKRRHRMPIVKSQISRTVIKTEGGKTFEMVTHYNNTSIRKFNMASDFEKITASVIFLDKISKKYILMILCENSSFYQYEILDSWAKEHLQPKQKTIDFSSVNNVREHTGPIQLGPGKDQFVDNDALEEDMEMEDYKEFYIMDIGGKMINVKLKFRNQDLSIANEIVVIPIDSGIGYTEITTAPEGLYTPEEYMEILEDAYEHVFKEVEDVIPKAEAVETLKGVIAGFPSKRLITILGNIIRETTNANLMERRSRLLNLLSTLENFTEESLLEILTGKKIETEKNETTNA